MTAPPEIHIAFCIYGDLQKVDQPPSIEDVSQAVGLEPTTASTARDVFVWKHSAPPVSSYGVHELVWELLSKLNDRKTIAVKLASWGLTSELRVAAYMHESAPSLCFPTSIINQFSELGCDVDIDLYNVSASQRTMRLNASTLRKNL